MDAHFPVLLVLAPLLVAPIVVIFASARFAWAAAMATSVYCFWVAANLLVAVQGGAEIHYELGGWAPPWGIELRVDQVNALVLTLVSGMSAVVLPFALGSLRDEVASDRIYLFYASWLLCLCGLLGITITADAFNVFVFLEISSLSTYVMVSLAQRRQALVSAFRYLIMGTVGATFILIGIGLLYMMTGTLNMADLAERLQSITHLRPVQAGIAFLFVGIMLKMALFPLHMWLPGAYTHAPMAVTAFLAATATKVAVYLLFRFAFDIVGAGTVLGEFQLGLPLALLGAGAALVGSLLALGQTRDVKRMLAYSSVAQIGYMALGIATGTVAALAGAILHLVNHALMKSALFMALGAARQQGGTQSLEGLAGAGKRMPVTMVAFTIAGLSLVGIPLTAGFLSKWYLVVGTFERGWWAVAALVIITSLMAAVYIGRLLEAVWLREPGDESPRSEASILLWGGIALLALANIYFGLETEFTAAVAESAARHLLQGYSP
jgi:multicomponent Na+:H+ antiporter subunit D